MRDIEKITFELFDSIHDSQKHKWKYRLFVDPLRRKMFVARGRAMFFNPRIKWPIWRLVGKIQEWVGGW